ncbi:cytochrome b/b6 domain-containing protein [Paraburkholderia kururiensis]|uniref:Cytochrome b/b6 domain-containing protein n=1 Tax=Paraburkholderia kururiensis TaxID=984307 RepID=A0ABZ0WKB3_9BURK|nr:cytochrome b/b6 domain-containing protein [Paraburkholderia kururiensis]WQD77763.1 cytochrome b/b6 domain-containing protein [Paraburkholderia kururiensis]
MAPDHRDAPPPAALPSRTVLIWDWPVRLFHWLTVALVAAAYVTARFNWIDWHVRIGETLLVLVVFRLLWGCFGSQTARFASFVAAPAAALRHLRALARREPDVQAGHNPAGGWMVLLLLALLAAETLTGLYVYNDVADEGPLSEVVPAAVSNAITALHSILWDALAVAVALHVCAVALYAFVWGQNLVRPMLDGRKQLPAHVREPRRAPLWLAILLFALAAGAVTLLANAI